MEFINLVCCRWRGCHRHPERGARINNNQQGAATYNSGKNKMTITLTDSRKHLFAQVNNWDEANIAARSVFKRKYWSDLYYSIKFDDGNEVDGSIDLEPYSFHARQQRELFTKHLKTFWGNISKSAGKYSITHEDAEWAAKLLTHLN